MSAAAILLPGAERRLLAGKSRTLLDPRWITVHTMVGTLAGTESWFRPAGRAYSHFGAGGDGEVRQWQDLRFRAASDLDGNPYSISWECEDTGRHFPRWTGSNVPAFTDAQAESLIVGLSWCCHRFNLPATAIATSCPHERGIGWHRLGVDPYRNRQCGQRWSSAYAKACPGNRRIHQLTTEIIPAISAPAPQEDPLVFTLDEARDAVRGAYSDIVGRTPADAEVDLWAHAIAADPRKMFELQGRLFAEMRGTLERLARS